MNSEERLAKVREMNDVVAILAEIRAESDADKEAKAQAAKAAKRPQRPSWKARN